MIKYNLHYTNLKKNVSQFLSAQHVIKEDKSVCFYTFDKLRKYYII